MPHRNRLVTLVLAASLAGAAPASAAEFVPGEVIVHHEGESAPEIVSLDAGETVPEAVADLEAAPGVDYAVPNYKAHASVIWNDPGRSGEPEGWTNLQWNFIGDASINAPDAWDLAASLGAPGGRGVVVAVVDTGAAYKTRGRFKRAPDLRRSTFVRGYDFVDRDRRPHDEFGHGTHVSGTIAQRVNNGHRRHRASPTTRRSCRSACSTRTARAAPTRSRAGSATPRSTEPTSSTSASSSTRRSPRARCRASSRRSGSRTGRAPSWSRPPATSQTRASPIPPARGMRSRSARRRSTSARRTTRTPGNSLDLVAPGGGNDAANVDNPRDAQYCRPDLTGRDIYQQTFTRNPRRFGLPGGYQGTSMAAPHVSATAALIIATERVGKNPKPGRVAAHLREHGTRPRPGRVRLPLRARPDRRGSGAQVVRMIITLQGA